MAARLFQYVGLPLGGNPKLVFCCHRSTHVQKLTSAVQKRRNFKKKQERRDHHFEDSEAAPGLNFLTRGDARRLRVASKLHARSVMRARLSSR